MKMKHCLKGLRFLPLSFALTLSQVSVVGAETLKADVNVQEKAAEATPQRIPSSFFEQERKLRRFGFGDFLDAALNGADNAFATSADPIAVTTRFPNSGFTLEPIYPSQVLEGIVVVGNRDSNSPLFLTGTGFISTTNNVSLSNVVPGVAFQNGTATVTYNGQTFVGRYSASGIESGDTFSGSILLINIQNPSQSILLQVSPTTIQGLENIPDSAPISAPGTISVGRPIDR
jgi:hypothetical protein